MNSLMNTTCYSDFEALRTGFGLIFASEMGRRVIGGGCELLRNG